MAEGLSKTISALTDAIETMKQANSLIADVQKIKADQLDFAKTLATFSARMDNFDTLLKAMDGRVDVTLENVELKVSARMSDKLSDLEARLREKLDSLNMLAALTSRSLPANSHADNGAERRHLPGPDPEVA